MGRGRLAQVYSWHLRTIKSSKRSSHKGVVPHHPSLAFLAAGSQIVAAIFWSVSVTSLKAHLLGTAPSQVKPLFFYFEHLFWSYGHHKTHVMPVDGWFEIMSQSFDLFFKYSFVHDEAFQFFDHDQKKRWLIQYPVDGHAV